MVADYFQPEEEGELVMAAVRGDTARTISLPLIEPAGAALLPGPRHLALDWFGGAPPYAVELAPVDDGEPLIDVSALPDPSLPPQAVDLAEGTYALTITDAKRRRVERELEVVAPAEVPQPPADPGLQSMPQDYQDLARTAWLSQQEDGRWRLQAYLNLREQPETFEPAHLLARTLAAGTDRQ